VNERLHRIASWLFMESPLAGALMLKAQPWEAESPRRCGGCILPCKELSQVAVASAAFSACENRLNG
jgi:hypothetical protein